MRRALTMVVVLGLSGLALGAPAEEKPSGADRNLITVTGEAEVRVAPDEFVLGFGVETRGLDLGVATHANERAVARVLALAKEAGIDDKLVQTGYMNVQPFYDDQRERARPLTLLGYVVERSVVVTLKDVRKMSGLRAAAIAAGANRLYALQMRTSELRKHRDEARLMAVRAAREKAVAIATELGQKVGRAHHIELDQPQAAAFSYAMQNSFQNVARSTSGDDGGDAGFAPGQISVSARVKVEFELE
jgi:uncharacterized protein